MLTTIFNYNLQGTRKNVRISIIRNEYIVTSAKFSVILPLKWVSVRRSILRGAILYVLLCWTYRKNMQMRDHGFLSSPTTIHFIDLFLAMRHIGTLFCSASATMPLCVPPKSDLLATCNVQLYGPFMQNPSSSMLSEDGHCRICGNILRADVPCFSSPNCRSSTLCRRQRGHSHWLLYTP